jgi:chloramphenicol 3-O phosphotransferase
MNKNKVIFLNGTSSSGKTTLAKAFQEIMEEPVLYVSNDKFIFMVSDRDLKDDSVRPKILIPLLASFHRAIPLIGECGFAMVIDSVIERKDWMDQIALSLEPLTTYCVKVYCSVDELDRREKARGDRKVGLARWQSGIVHGFIDYDLVIDTEGESTNESVEKLKQLYYSNIEPQAFDVYRKKLKSNPLSS